MAWIESHQELGQHPKTKRLARALQISLPAAVGHLQFLWWWALNYAQNGDLSKYTDEDIADAICWDGDAKQAVDALIHSGFIDKEPDATLAIHDWYEYAGRLLDQREAQAKYKQRQYALYNDLRLTRAVKQRDGDICQYCGKAVNWNDRRGVDGGTYDHIDPDGENTLNNLVVCCRSCNSKKGERTPEQARMPFIFGGYTLTINNNTANNGRFTADMQQIPPETRQEQSTITQPNLTIPNHTIPNPTEQNPTQCPPQAEGGGAGTEQARFDEFWAIYPKKVGKADARKSWKRVKPNAELHSKILAAVERAKQTEQWQRENGRFIPNPSTWLNQGRWDDEPMPPNGNLPPQPPGGGRVNTLDVLTRIIAETEGGGRPDNTE